MKNWSIFYKKNFGISKNFPSSEIMESGRLKLFIPPLFLQKDFFSRKRVFRGQNRGMFREKRVYLKWMGWELILSADTVGNGLLRDIEVTNRPDKEYFLSTDDSMEVSGKVINSPLATMEDKLGTGESGLTLFEYLVFYALRSEADKIYMQVALNTRLPDGKIICLNKNLKLGFINIFAWPKEYSEHNSQGTRGGYVSPI